MIKNLYNGFVRFRTDVLMEQIEDLHVWSLTQNYRALAKEKEVLLIKLDYWRRKLWT